MAKKQNLMTEDILEAMEEGRRFKTTKRIRQMCCKARQDYYESCIKK